MIPIKKYVQYALTIKYAINDECFGLGMSHLFCELCTFFNLNMFAF